MIQSSSSETLLKERSTLSQRAVLEDTLAACCLYFKSPGRNFCASCPILTKEDRLSRNRSWVRAQKPV